MKSAEPEMNGDWMHGMDTYELCEWMDDVFEHVSLTIVRCVSFWFRMVEKRRIDRRMSRVKCKWNDGLSHVL